MIIFSGFGIGYPNLSAGCTYRLVKGSLLLIRQNRTARPEAWWRASVERRAARIAWDETMMRLTTVVPVPLGTVCYVTCTPSFPAHVTHPRSPDRIFPPSSSASAAAKHQSCHLAYCSTIKVHHHRGEDDEDHGPHALNPESMPLTSGNNIEAKNEGGNAG